MHIMHSSPHICFSAFYRSSYHTINKVSLEAKEYYQDRNDTKHGSGDQHVIVIAVRCQQSIQTDRQCKLICITIYHHRPEQVVPGTHRRQNSHRSKCRFCDRENDFYTNTVFCTTIDPPCIQQVFGQTYHILPEEEYGRSTAQTGKDYTGCSVHQV